jgi:hypothetical protein
MSSSSKGVRSGTGWRKAMKDVPLGALRWLRNHYDVGRPELKEQVLARIDAVLKDFDVKSEDSAEFRRRYPAEHFKASEQREASGGAPRPVKKRRHKSGVD